MEKKPKNFLVSGEGELNLEDEDMQDGEMSSDFEEVDDMDGFSSSDVNESEDGQADEDEDNEAEEEELEDQEGGVQIANGRAISPSSIPFSGTASASAVEPLPGSLDPQRQTPYNLDAGHLLVNDPNPLDLSSTTNPIALESQLLSTARDATQTLLNHLLTTCPIHTVPTTSTSSSGVTISLPPPVFQLPREKKIPTPRPPTKWEQFAARKGIGKYGKKSAIGKGDLASTEGKKVYDEASGEWVPKWGYKGKNKKGEGDWLVEVDEKKERRELEAANPRKASRTERIDRMRRNERAQKANEKHARKKAAA